MSLPTPNTRKEQYLNAIATGNAGGLPTPITREEEYLDAIAKSGGGGGEGDMKKSVYDSDLTVANAGGIGAFVGDAVSGKVDKVAGKGLSTNDYSDTEKGKVTANAEAIEAITGVYGAKNLVDIPDTTRTSGGYIVNQAPIYLPSGNYVLTFDFNGTSSTSEIIILDANHESLDRGTFTVKSGTNEVSLILARDAFYITYFTNGVGDYSKFMIRDARIKDSTYVPYAMTNKELTEKVITIEYKELTSDGIGWISVPYDGRTIISAIGSGGAFGLVRDFDENHTIQRIQLYSCDPINDTWHVSRNATVTLGLVYLKD